MAYDYSPITWTDEQWARVTDTIQQEANRARVAATFLPLYGPLPPDTDYVAKDEITPQRALRSDCPSTTRRRFRFRRCR